MNNHSETNLPEESNRSSILYPFLGGILGIAAIVYAWLRYAALASRPDVNWYDWISPTMLMVVGFVCLLATVLFVVRNSNALSVLKLGLSLIPLLLFVNLIILIFRVVENILNGNAGYLLERILSQPQKFLLNPILVLALILLSALSKSDRKNA